MAREGKARLGKGRQGTSRQGKLRQGKARQGKSRQGKAREDKEQYKARQVMTARQGKASNEPRDQRRGERRKFKIVGPRPTGYFVRPATYRRSLFFWDFIWSKLKRTGKLRGGKIFVLYTPDKFV